METKNLSYPQKFHDNLQKQAAFLMPVITYIMVMVKKRGLKTDIISVCPRKIATKYGTKHSCICLIKTKKNNGNKNYAARLS